jgi:hypothetical protein
LGSPNGENAISDEIEDRLDDLFGEEEPSSAGLGGGVDSKDAPLRELKTIILSIDWEITDEVMTKLIEQIAVLKKTFKDDRIPLVFLQLLGSLGEYIKINRGKSHPDAFKILNSLFKELDKVVQLETLTESEKKQILSSEVNKYKTLKKQLDKDKAERGKVPQVQPSEERIPETVELKDLAVAIMEIKQLIQEEFKALKNELKSLNKGESKSS